MGICKCKKRTESFCFVHSKAVCDDCICDHKTCYVKSYVEWVTSSVYDKLQCSICNGTIEESDENIVRLKCHDVLHKPCLESYFSRDYKDENLGCPACKEPIIPLSTDHSRLATLLRETLLSFTSVSVNVPEEERVSISSPSTPIVNRLNEPIRPQKDYSRSFTDDNKKSNVLASKKYKAPKFSPNPALNMNFPNNEISKLSARKTVTAPSNDTFNYAMEEEDDKYKKKNIIEHIPILRTFVRLLRGMFSTRRRSITSLIVLLSILIFYYIWISFGNNEEKVRVYTKRD